MQKLLDTLDSLLQHVSVRRVLLVSFLIAFGITAYTFFENRQEVYGKLASAKIVDDYEIDPPGQHGIQLMKNLLKKYPSIAMISLIDADPIRNERRVIHREYNDPEIQLQIGERLKIEPLAGNGPLYSNDPAGNQQVVSVMAGEFVCMPNKGTILAKSFNISEKQVAYSCRVPLPPAFNKATGWFTIQLKKWPEERIEELKYDALKMSIEYFDTEIMKTGPVKIK